VPIGEIEAKSVLQRSGIPGVAYVINPYTGCVHQCVYCYARFMKRFTNHAEPWGAFLDAKVNAPEVLRKQLQRKRTPIEGSVLLSSVTDPYLPAEAKCKLTRRILEVLLEHQVPVSILTKSDMVRRDLDLLAQFEQCRVGLSVMTVDDQIGRRFERGAPSPTRRIRALRELRESGMDTYAFISPYLPELSDIDALLKALDGAIGEFGIEALNTREAYWAGVARVVAKFYPELLPEYRQLVRDPTYWDALEDRAARLAARRQIPFMGVFRH